MATKDLKSNIKVSNSILPAAVTGNTTGTAVSLAGYESAVFALAATGVTVAGTFKLTESATSGGTYTDVSAADTIGTQGVAVVEDGVVTLGYKGSLGFIKPVFTHSGNGTIGCTAILGTPLVAPTV